LETTAEILKWNRTWL